MNEKLLPEPIIIKQKTKNIITWNVNENLTIKLHHHLFHGKRTIFVNDILVFDSKYFLFDNGSTHFIEDDNFTIIIKALLTCFDYSLLI